MVNDVDVVVVADPDDPHYLAIEERLRMLGAQTLRLNFADFPAKHWLANLGLLTFPRVAAGRG